MKVTICTRPAEVKREKNVFANIIRDILVGGLVWFVTHFIIRAFYTGWDVPYNSKVTIWIPVIALVLSFVLAEAPWRRWACIGYMVVFAGQVLLFFGRIKQGVSVLWNIIIVWVQKEYGVVLAPMTLDSELPQEETYLVLIVVQVLCVWLLLGLRNRGFWILWMFLSLVLVCSSLSVNECPDTTCIIAYAVAVFALLVVRGFLEGPASKACIYMVCTVVFFALIALVITTVVGEEKYEKFIEAKDYRKELYTFVNEVVLGFEKDSDKSDTGKGNGEGDGTSSMGMAGGKLPTNSSGVASTGEVHLLVTLPKNSPTMYLRAYVGSKYRNNAWHEVTESEGNLFERAAERLNSGIDVTTYTNLLNYRFFLTNSETGFTAAPYAFPQFYSSVIVENVAANEDYVYAPYVTFGDTGITGDVNGYWKPTDNKSKVIYYQQIYNEEGVPFHYSFENDVALDLWQLQGASPYYFSEFDSLYRDFVYDYYLQIPGECRAVARTLSSTGDLRSDVNQVIEYLQSHYRYTTYPGKLPEGEDVISYFMWQSKQGYCMHFASAAVIMLRGMGIPARYVEGYVVREHDIDNGVVTAEAQGVCLGQNGQISTITQEYVEVAVRDSEAHAWVEVYIDGYGWFPVDVTSGDGSSISGNIVPTPTTGVEPGVTNTPTPRPTMSVGNTNTPTPTPTKGQTAGGNQGGGTPTITPTENKFRGYENTNLFFFEEEYVLEYDEDAYVRILGGELVIILDDPTGVCIEGGYAYIVEDDAEQAELAEMIVTATLMYIGSCTITIKNDVLIVEYDTPPDEIVVGGDWEDGYHSGDIEINGGEIPGITVDDLNDNMITGKGEASVGILELFLRICLWIGVLAIVAVLVLYLRYRYLRGIRYMRCRSKYTRKAVKAYFMEIRGLLPYWGVQQEKWEDDAAFSERAADHLPKLSDEYEITEVAATALRAAFSKEKVEEAERDGIAKYYRSLRSATLQKLPTWKRFYVKYLQCR